MRGRRTSSPTASAVRRSVSAIRTPARRRARHPRGARTARSDSLEPRRPMASSASRVGLGAAAAVQVSRRSGQLGVAIEVEQQQRELHCRLAVDHRMVDLHEQPDAAVVEPRRELDRATARRSRSSGRDSRVAELVEARRGSGPREARSAHDVVLDGERLVVDPDRLAESGRAGTRGAGGSARRGRRRAPSSTLQLPERPAGCPSARGEDALPGDVHVGGRRLDPQEASRPVLRVGRVASDRNGRRCVRRVGDRMYQDRGPALYRLSARGNVATSRIAAVFRAGREAARPPWRRS